MNERKNQVTLEGNPLTLLGPELSPGDRAPDVTVISNDMAPVKVSDFKGKILIISAVPSLDTPVCDMETRRFNKEASGLGNNVEILTVSMDLPFAQKRWCAATGVDRVQTVSDHREAQFAQQYGVLIKELRLLARTVFVVDGAGVIRYIQRVSEVTSEPDYQQVIDAVKALQKVAV